MTTSDPLSGPAVGLVVDQLVVAIGGRTIIDGVSLAVSARTMLAVTGPSGAGKSTLLAVLAGLLKPASGSVRFDGEIVRVGTVEHARRIGLVLQGYGLVAALTAAENVELPLQLLGLPRTEVAERAARALRRAGLPELTERMVEELSGGQQQRVAVARALVNDPVLVIADEPTAELDAVTRDVVLRAFREEAEHGAIVVLATHDPDAAAQCDGVIHLVDGRTD